MRALIRLVLAVGAAGLFAGCQTVPVYDAAYQGPFFQPHNFAGEKRLAPEIRRVILLPISTQSLAQTETAASLDEVLSASLQSQQRFEVIALSREECRSWFGSEAFASTAALPHGMFDKLVQRYAADAVLFVDLTVYQPYRPQSIGLRAKLATLKEVRLLWTFDEVMSATDPAVANSARRHALTQDRGLVPVDLSPTALQSPGRFAAFAADAMFATLPPR